MYHLLLNSVNHNWPEELRKSFPWILWRIWTNRNLTLFEGKSFSALEMVEKIREDVKEWFEAQVVEVEEEGNERGGAWVLRDSNGVVLLHSRKAFANIGDKLEAQLMVLFWAIESMKSHKIDNVVFALQSTDLVGAVNRPKAWPSLRYHSSEILERKMLDCKIKAEEKEINQHEECSTSDCSLPSRVSTTTTRTSSNLGRNLDCTTPVVSTQYFPLGFRQNHDNSEI
ncbi:Ribonuclease H domain [Arabidopsis suecica]|uniref:Ribonuclease H domain n=1 Tax=Arabidopsis suecica TaxID=45249 RepID=A0A8T1YPI7_ARASU|nr:Ribonuclease H domain [Arabidopsis suecica]